MPRFKTPSSLVKLCLEVVALRVVNCCRRELISGSEPSYVLQQCLDVFKKLSVDLPKTFLPTLYNFIFVELRQLENTLPNEYLEMYKRVMKEITVISFDPAYIHDIQGSTVLNLSDFPSSASPISLEKYRLKKIEILTLPDFCTLSHLRIIVKEFLQLRVFNIQNNANVTDTKLRVLTECKNLRYVNISNCMKVTRKGIHNLLRTIPITEFHGWPESNGELTILTHPDEICCPDITHFTVISRHFTKLHTERMMKKFPNLISIRFPRCYLEDLTPLRNLDELKMLEFDTDCNFSLDHLKVVLSKRGASMSSLKIPSIEKGVQLLQRDLNQILDYCINIEHLSFCFKPRRVSETIFVKSLNNLKTLHCCVPVIHRRRIIELELNRMIELQSLSFSGFRNSRERIEKMMLSQDFPNLTSIRMHYNTPEELDYFKQLALTNNLDLTVTDYPIPEK